MMGHYDETPIGILRKQNQELQAQVKTEANRMAKAASDILRLNNDNRELRSANEVWIERWNKQGDSIARDRRRIKELEAQVDAVRAACKFTKYPPYHVIDVDKDKLEAAIKGEK